MYIGINSEAKLDTINGPILARAMVGQTIDVWDGRSYVPAETQKFPADNRVQWYLVNFDNGVSILCTHGSEFELSGRRIVDAASLTAGDVLKPWKMPDSTVNVVTVVSVEPVERKANVYAVHNPISERILVNGIAMIAQPYQNMTDEDEDTIETVSAAPEETTDSTGPSDVSIEE